MGSACVDEPDSFSSTRFSAASDHLEMRLSGPATAKPEQSLEVHGVPSNLGNDRLLRRLLPGHASVIGGFRRKAFESDKTCLGRGASL